MLLAMIAIGSWVTQRIEETVVRNTANATALYMESFISPLSQDLARSSVLSAGAKRAMDEIFTNTPLGDRVASFKIWKEDGLIVESSNSDLTGRRFEISENLRAAFRGEVRADFEELGDPEDSNERAMGLPLLEIYSPIREVWSGRIIGVAEFYEVATALKEDLERARRNSWATVALSVLLIGVSLYAIVLRGSRTIDRQLEDLTRLSEHNTALRLRVQQAVSRFTAMNDDAMRRIGADLHDGPAQLMAFAALRIDNLRAEVDQPRALAELDEVERAVKDAIREIRNISRGVSLPDIEQRSLDRIVEGVADAHSARTGTEVKVRMHALEGNVALPVAVRICVYRFVQEGLNNAWFHAAGKGQEVRVTLTERTLRVRVLDEGPGFPDLPVSADPPEGGMGLSGLQDRVESLGGIFEKLNRQPRGAELRMTLDLGGTT
ncbi:sensor histidine kinase [Rhodobacter sp. NSM]|uniref:sensor histidine kinase n=1 Tax=Rhodobacter sp. NSM TaxID=3457501 RepID=UPI003FD3861A